MSEIDHPLKHQHRGIAAISRIVFCLLIFRPSFADARTKASVKRVYDTATPIVPVSGGESLFLRKLVLGIPAQASGKNLTRPLMPSAPRPPCVRAAPPHHRKLGAGYAALPQMARRDCSDAYFVFPLALVPRTTEKQCGLITTGD
jgi:hypothetical protein